MADKRIEEGERRKDSAMGSGPVKRGKGEKDKKQDYDQDQVQDYYNYFPFIDCDSRVQ